MDLFESILIFIFTGFIVFLLIISISNILEKNSCYSQANAMHLEVSYGFMQGCIVHKDNQYFDIDNYQYTYVKPIKNK